MTVIPISFLCLLSGALPAVNNVVMSNTFRLQTV